MTGNLKRRCQNANHNNYRLDNILMTKTNLSNLVCKICQIPVDKSKAKSTKNK